MEDIDDEYAYCYYYKFKVIIHKTDGYINASKLCKQHNKLLRKWLRKNCNIVNTVEQSIGSTVLYYMTTGNNPQNFGVYVHKMLMPHIVSWISPEFLIDMSHLMVEHIDNMVGNGGDNGGDNDVEVINE